MKSDPGTKRTRVFFYVCYILLMIGMILFWKEMQSEPNPGLGGLFSVSILFWLFTIWFISTVYFIAKRLWRVIWKFSQNPTNKSDTSIQK